MLACLGLILYHSSSLLLYLLVGGRTMAGAEAALHVVPCRTFGSASHGAATYVRRRPSERPTDADVLRLRRRLGALCVDGLGGVGAGTKRLLGMAPTSLRRWIAVSLHSQCRRSGGFLRHQRPLQIWRDLWLQPLEDIKNLCLLIQPGQRPV